MPTWYGSWSRSREPEPWSKTDRLRSTGWRTDLITLSLLLQFSLLWFVHTEKTWCVGIPLHTVCFILFFTRKKTYTSRPKVCIGKTSEAQTGLFSQSLKIISRKIFSLKLSEKVFEKKFSYKIFRNFFRINEKPKLTSLKINFVFLY